MLLNDSLEFETNLLSNQAKLVPMLKWNDIKLSNIWIPSELLINRQQFSHTFSNEHRSIISHTLVKHKVVDTLSIYSDPEVLVKNSFASSEKLLDSLEELPKKFHDIEHAPLQKVKETKSSYSGNECTNTIHGKENEALLEENYDSPNNSIADYLEHLILSDDDEENKQNVTVDTHNSNYVELLETYEKPSTLEGDMPIEKDSLLHKDVVQKSEIFNERTEDISRIPLEFLQKQDSTSEHDYQKIQVNTRNANDALEMNDNKLPSTLKSDMSPETYSLLHKDDQKFEIFKEKKEGFSLIPPGFFQKKENQLNDRLSFPEKDDLNQTNRSHSFLEDASSAKSSNLYQNADSSTEVKNCSDEPVEEFPFLLQKDKNKEIFSITNKGKTCKKDKKLKKKTNKNIVPLDNFFLSKSENELSSNNMADEYLKYCENLSVKLCGMDISEKSYPSLAGREKQEEKSSNIKQLKEESKYFENDSGSVTTTLFSQNNILSLDCNAARVKEPENNVTKYVIENVPLFVDEDMLQSLLVTFGEVMKVSIERSGKALNKAIVEVDVEDPNWIIECLSGNQPFGASSGENVKCYQIL